MDSLIDRLRERARSEAARRAFTFLLDGDTEGPTLTWGELDERARAIAVCLREAVPRQPAGERALLVYPPGLEFLQAFLGCLYGGVVAVPAYPPGSRRTLPRLAAIVRDARPSVVLTCASHLERFRSLSAALPELAGLPWIATDAPQVGAELAAGWRPLTGTGDAVAFLQYTSGSTSVPKGVEVTHGNLAANEEMIRRAFEHTEDSVVVGWLPFYHDMGLIGNLLQPVYSGSRCVLMSPWAFLRRPSRWLRAVSRYRGTTSGGPNFAYDLCLKKAKPEDREGLDLASWRIAFNGAEPVRAETLRRFAATFSEHGFRPQAFFPCYGLAEATLFVTGSEVARPAKVLTVAADALAQDRVETALTETDARTADLVSSGVPSSGLELAIVDPATARPCAPDRIGEVLVAGPSVAHGYRDRPEDSERTFGACLHDGTGPFLRTGDLGFLQGGELFVTGRLKDLIILRGRNLYPQDVEWSAEASHAALRPQGAAAFSVDVDGEERLVVVQEIERRREAEAQEAAEAVRRALAEEHEARAWDVVIARAGAVPKTSSGKVRRRPCRDAYLAGELEVIARSTVASTPEAANDEPLGLDREALLAMDAAERPALLEAYLSREAAAAAHLPGTRIDADTPLTTLGFDSLAAVELEHRLQSDLEVEVAMADLLSGATVSSLASSVLEQLADPGQPRQVQQAYRLTAGDVRSELPLSAGQEALWFLARLAPTSSAYHLCGAARVRGGLDVQALQRAFRALVGRHGALRTTFHRVDGRPRQRIEADERGRGFVTEAASSWTSESVRARLHDEAYRPFDLEVGPLVRLLVLEVSSRHHQLLLAVHHLVADLWSVTVLLRELGQLYTLETGGTAAPPEPRITYGDWIRWRDEVLAGPQGERLESYWLDRLAKIPHELDLPVDRPRPRLESFRGARVTRLLDTPLRAELHGLARKTGSTSFMVLLAAFQVVLRRYSGQRQFLVGSPTSGRESAEAEDLVGYCVNPVVLAADLTTPSSGRKHVFGVRQTVLEAFEHQGYPFPRLAQRLQPHRDGSRSPLFQVMFALQKAQWTGGEALAAFALGHEGVELGLGRLTLESLALEERSAPFELSLLAAQWNGRLGLALSFNTDLWDVTTGRRFIGHFESLLQALLADPDRQVAELPLLRAVERHELLVEWNDGMATVAEAPSVHQLFEAAAQRHSAAVAVVCGDREVRYGELAERSRRLAHVLHAAGAGPETVVALCLERSLDLVVGYLGILRSGAACLPLDPSYPPQRLSFLLRDSGARLAVTRGALRDLVAGVATVLIEPSGGTPRSTAQHEVDAEHAAYVIYTSGSTGRPKGVVVSHGAAGDHLAAARARYALTSADVVLHTASFSFDASIEGLWAPLSCGARVELTGPRLASPADVLRRSEARGVTVMNLPPAYWSAVLQHSDAPPAALRLMIVGGDAMPTSVHRRWTASEWSKVRLLNAYGPTEATITSTLCEMPTVPRTATAAAPLGRPVGRRSVHVLDPGGRLVASGAAGELAVGGPLLARGYLHRPRLTAERFVPDPWAVNGAGGRLYLTGDRARRGADGELQFLGRLDRQLEIRGFRIEPGEVETVLVEQPEVSAAVVTALTPRRAGGAEEKVLAAYVVADTDPEELRRRLEAELPAHLVPSFILQLDALPLLPNGKVDRRALPAPEGPPAAAYMAPRTPVEEILAGIWSEVLGIERVGVHDRFFDLGGHSLLATRMIARIRRALGVEVELRHMLERPTVAALADQVAAAAPATLAQGTLAQAPPLVPVPRGDALPLSFSQERLWFLDRLSGGDAAYNMPAAVRLVGELEGGACRAALTEIVRRHEVLRTRFENGGEAVQVVTPPSEVALPRVDLSRLGEAGRLPHALALAQRQARRAFDLAQGPHLRATLLGLGPRDHVLVFVLHHIVFDGWSTGILLHELQELYGAFHEPRTARLPALPIQYSDYAAWQRKWLGGTSETLERQLAFWRRRLTGIQVLDLPTDRPRSHSGRLPGATLPVRLPAVLSRSLEALGRRRGGTLFMTLLASFAVLLGRWTGQSDVAVGSPIANRRRQETEELIGFFVNTVVLRLRLGGGSAGPDATFGALLDRARETVLEADAHQDVPFERVVEELQPERDPDVTPLFQVMLALQEARLAAPRLPGLDGELLEIGSGSAKFDLTLNLSLAEATLQGNLEYRTDLFDATTARRFLKHFERLLTAAVRDPGQRIPELSFLAPAERHELLVEWSGATSYLPDATIPELFDLQLRRSLDAVAVVCDESEVLDKNRTWSYGELDLRARALARSLRDHGVGPEMAVGLCLDRCPELIVALFAIWKAAGVYVALDPELPAERLAFMVEDTGAQLLLTRESLRNRLPDNIPALCLGQTPSADLPGVRRPAGPCPTADDLAYVIYTSGSTGKPKGVAVTHANLVPMMRWSRDHFGIDSRTRVLQTLAPTFDFGVFEILTTLLCGGTLHMTDAAGLGDAELYSGYVRRHGINLIHATPSFVRSLVTSGASFPGLGILHLGGEALSAQDLDTFFAALDPACEIHNGYGPTEATINSTIFNTGSARNRRDARRTSTPIGRASANNRTYVLNATGRPLPIGVTGELHVGGDGLMRGYLRRPALTADKLIPDPFTSRHGARLYRTGDRVRIRPGGEIEFLGRTDDQVKLRGFRIELGEVEAALLAQDELAAAAVVVTGGSAGPSSLRLVACVVADDTGMPPLHEIERRLQERLPAFMVPSPILEVETLPVTPSGKVDRRALRRHVAARFAPRDEASFVAPRTAVEELLAGIWGEVLGVDRVGVHDDFFTLGGHSLLATRLLSRIRRTLSVDLELRRLFESTTIAKQAEEIAARRSGRAASGTPPIPTRPPGQDPPPLSFAQERLWFLDQLEPGSPAYNIAAAVAIRGDLDVPRLRQTFLEVTRRHATLRTTFSASRGQPFQVTCPEAGFALPEIDLTDLPAARRDRHLLDLSRDEARRGFDLEHGPLVRARLLRLGRHQHVLVLVMHHIVSDGWSIRVLVREVGALYAAAGTPQAAGTVPVLPVQYADYAAWQRHWLRGAVLERQLTYWRDRLTGSASLELPTDRPRRPGRSPGGERSGEKRPAGNLAVTLPDLGAFSRCHGATAFMTLLAAFSAWLARLTGRLDLALGSPIANRNRLETEDLIGFFVNTLVLRLDLRGDPAFQDLVERARDTTLGAYDHQDLPFERLVEELRPERRLDATPFFNVVLALDSTPAEVIALPGLEAETLPLSGGRALFDLYLLLEPDREGLRGTLEYRRDLFDGTTVRRFVRQLATLLAAATTDPSERLSRLPWLTAAEHLQLVGEWNDTSTSYPASRTLAELFEVHAVARPDAVALVSERRHLSFRQLDRLANGLARQLERLGVGPEVPVGLCLERSGAMVMATLGVLKAGGAYLPLDPSYPAGRLALMMEDARCPVVLAEDHLVARLAGAAPHAAHLVRWDEARLAEEGDTPRPRRCGARHLAYVIYTSGSTGRPKGVAVEHRSVVRLVRETSFADLGPRQVFLQLAPASFDAATLEIWAPLVNGGRLVVAPPHPLSPAELGELVERHRITTLWLTAGLFHQVVEHRAHSLRGVNELLAGGDVLAAPRVREVLAATPRTTLINGYGPTENTTFTACHRMSSPSAVGDTVAIGRPIANTRVFLLDRGLRPVPVGVTGQLCAAGAGLARDYARRPALTAGRFLPDPLSTSPGERLYLTGDQARYRPDGTIEFLGRRDHQVKIRGFRIEPGETEAALAALPGVESAAVVVHARPTPEGPADKQLVAYVVPRSDAEPAPAMSDLRRRLEELLPPYMVPAALVAIDALPLTPNGKVDRGALSRKPLQAPAWTATDFVAPRTPGEEILAGIWCETLRLEQIGVHDDFFDLGGHSLLATRTAARLREAFGVELSLRLLFEKPTLGELAAEIEALRSRGTAPPWPPLVPVSRDSERARRGLPLSYAQERLWFLHQVAPESAAYNVASAVRLRGVLRPAVLDAGLSEIVRRHETLRTTFRTIAGEPRQVIAPPATFRAPRIDLGVLPPARGRRELVRLVGDEARRPYDLASEGPLRAALVALPAADGQADHVLQVTLHHIASDGWSMSVFLEELTALYSAGARGRPSPLPELEVRYADFAVWQRGWLEAGTDPLESELAYWRGQLGETSAHGEPPVLELPFDRPRRAALTLRGSAFAFDLPRSLAGELRRLARERQATLFMTLLAAFQALLARITGQHDVAVGSPVAGRPVTQTEPLIGFFVNTLVLRGDLAGNPTFGELLDRLREVTLDAFAHQDVPFEKLVDELKPHREATTTPFFQVAFALQNTPRPALDLEGLAVERLAVESSTAKFDLTLGLYETEAGIAGELEYRADLFDRTTVLRLARHYRRLLADAAARPGTRLAALAVLAAAEAAQLVTEWPALSPVLPRGAVPYDRDAALPELFEAQVERAPDAAAVVAGEGLALSYRQLNQRANQLAHALRALGVGRESAVGIALERCADFVLAVLGVLKAGGSYVPLDPSYPRERLDFMTDDAGIEVWIGHRGSMDVEKEGVRAVLLDSGLDGHSAENPPRVSGPLDQLYVIYTSGSTGRPKGVSVPHRAVTRLVLCADYVEIRPGDRVAHASNTAFDAATFEIWGALLHGATLVVVPPEVALSPADLARELRDRRISHFFLTTALFNEVARLATRGPFSTLRTVLFGGEAVDPRWVAHVLETGAPERLLHVYGPTENTTFSTWHPVLGVRPGARTVPIGRSISASTFFVVGRALEPMPLGVPGELVLGGDGLARGYFARGALTAERFVPNLFSAAPGSRLYRTGDRVRTLPDGSIEFLERLDHQVKLRGFRIELGEIEEALRDHPRVDEAVVLAVGTETKRLVAWIVTGAGDRLEVAELRDALRRKLPEVMVPSAFLELDALPLTPNGKLDRAALPSPDEALRSTEMPYVAPATDLEATLVSAWTEVLDVPRVGIDDNFFEVGGNSLLMARLAARLEEELGRRVPIVELFRFPTVRTLGRHLSEGTDEAEALAGVDEAAAQRRKSMDGRRQRRRSHRVS